MDTDKNDNSKGLLQKGVEFFREAMKDGWENHEREIYYNGYYKGRNFQREQDLISTIVAFLELNVKDGEIYKLLNKHFDVNSIDEVNELLLKGKKQKKAVDYVNYIFSLEMNESDTIHYTALYNSYPEKDKFLNMMPQKIKEFLEKNNNL